MASSEKPLVSYLGPNASYSHQAARQAFSDEEWELRPVTTIEDVFDTVQDGDVAVGLVPFENSTNGSVVFTLDDLADRNGRYRDVTVVGEVYVDVHHCLLGRKDTRPMAEDGGDGSGACTPTPDDPSPSRPRTKPLGSLKHIRRLYSHPQAFGQCTAFISTYLKGVEVFEVSSTSKAAEVVKDDTTGTWAAISSQLAAELHHLDFLGRSIEDRSDNMTRFLIIRKGPVSPGEMSLTPEPTQFSVQILSGVRPGRDSKSLVSFTVPHDSPGALAEVLSCFKAYDLNLTSINSRPSLQKPFQYIFFIEFEGNRNVDPDQSVQGALERIDRVAASWRWLGSWARYR